MAEVIWTETALDDLDAIADYIALDKPGAAKHLVQQVFARVEQLKIFPMSGGKQRELAGTPYRQLVIRPVRIFYRVNAETVYIVYVVRGEQQFHLTDVTERER